MKLDDYVLSDFGVKVVIISIVATIILGIILHLLFSPPFIGSDGRVHRAIIGELALISFLPMLIVFFFFKKIKPKVQPLPNKNSENTGFHTSEKTAEGLDGNDDSTG